MGKIIKKGIVKKKIHGRYENKEYQMKLIGQDYLPEIINLQDVVVKDLKTSEIFQADNREFFKNELKKGGKIIGVFTDNDLIAYRFITMPKGDSMNLGLDLELSKNELDKVGHLETTIVHPDFRGNGLQSKTLFVALDIFKYFEHYHICSTISPKNYHSLNNVMAGGLVIKRLKNKYGGKLRYILHRNLAEELKIDYLNNIDIDNVEILRRQKLLEKGFVGYKALKNDKGFSVRYGLN